MPSGTVTPAGGGGSSAVGATIGLVANVVVSDGQVVPLDTALTDPSGFFDAANKRLRVPAGLGGLYLYGFAGAGWQNTGTVSALGFTGSIDVGNASAIYAGFGVDPYNGFSGSATGLGRFADGDAVLLYANITGGGTAHILGGSNTSQLWMLRVAD